MTQGENLSLQVSTHSEGTSERPQQRKQDGHHRFGRLHGRARKFKGIKADGVFGRDTPVRPYTIRFAVDLCLYEKLFLMVYESLHGRLNSLLVLGAVGIDE